MEIRVLRYFLAVSQAATISGAANYLHISQPTLSRQLMDLEAELGAKLFDRGSRRIKLTEEGMFLYKRAQEIVNLLEKTEAAFLAGDEIINGDVYIGGGETEAMRLIARVANKLQTAYPGVHYHLFSGNADDVTERLDKGLLDFGILIEPADVSKYEFLNLPAKDIWGVLMKSDSPLAKKERILAEDLVDLPLITSRQSLVANNLSAWMGRSADGLNIVATYNLLFNASLLVEEGLGYGLTIDKLINTMNNSGLCFRPLYPQLEAGLSIVWKKHQVFSKAAAKFLEYIQAEFGQ